MTFGDEEVDHLAGALDIVDTHIGYAAVEDGLEYADARRQPRCYRLVTEGQDAGKEDQTRRLVGVEKLQIFDRALGVVLGYGRSARRIRATRASFSRPTRMLEKVWIADIRGDDQDHVRAAEAQAASHGIGRIAGDRDRLVDLQPRGFSDLLRVVDCPRYRRDRNFSDPGDVFDGCGRGIRHCALPCVSLLRVSLNPDLEIKTSS